MRKFPVARAGFFALLYLLLLAVFDACHRFRLHWYLSLEKPTFCPEEESLVFLYAFFFALLLAAGALSWEGGGRLFWITLFHAGNAAAIVLLFFTIKSPVASLVVVLLSVGMGISELPSYFCANRWAGVLALIYFLWLSFLAAFNYSILMLN